MKNKRTIHKPDFKAKVAREAIEGRETASEIGAKYGVHPQQVTDWKREAIKRMAEIFQRKSKKVEVDPTENVADLQKKVGKLSMEIDFLERGLALVAEPKKGK
jgi:transposase-like protein